MFLYAASGLDENLADFMFINEQQYVVYGDSEYRWCIFLEVPLDGSNPSIVQSAFNNSMSKVRTVAEWFFKRVE